MPILAILIAKAYNIGALWVVMFGLIGIPVGFGVSCGPGYIVGGVIGMTRPKLLK